MFPNSEIFALFPDNTVSTYGGFIHFKNSKIEPIECSDSDLKVLLVNTNVPRSTKSMVQAVNKMYQNYPEVVGPTLDAINGVSEKSLEKCSKRYLDKYSDRNQEIYSKKYLEN